MSKKEDLRSIKTIKAIKRAFLELLYSKKFREITINDIAEKSVINRSTFYLHYTDKFDLLNNLVDNGITKVTDTVSLNTHIRNGNLDYHLFSVDLDQSLKVIASRAQLYKFILNDPESLGLRQKMDKALSERLNKCFPLETLVSRDLLIEIISSIYLSVICWWLNNDMKYSSKFMAHELVKFFKLGSRSLLLDPLK